MSCRGPGDSCRSRRFCVPGPCGGAAGGSGTPLMLTELVPDTDNENGADAYEYFEITNVSDRAVSLDQYQIIYNVTDLWEPDQDGIVIEPGQSLLLWIINDGNRELTADDFNRYYTEKTGAEQSFEIGKDLATVHSGASN